MISDHNNPGRGPLGRHLINGHLGESLLEQFIADFGLSEPAAIEMIAWFEEKAPRAHAHDGNHGQELRRLRELFYTILEQTLLAAPAEAQLTLKMILWRSGLPFADDLIANQSPADWCRPAGITKQACFKQANEIGDRLGFPRRPDQRDAIARAKMSTKRLQPKPKQ